MPDQNSWLRSRVSKHKDALIAVIGLSAGAASLAAGVFGGAPRNEALEYQVDLMKQQLADVYKGEIGNLRSEVKQLKDASASGQTEIPVALLRSSIDALDARTKLIESELLNTPEKALSLPLLRQDIEGFKQQHQRDVAGLSADISRVYDINKWVLGLIGGALIVSAVNRIFSKGSAS